MEKKIVKDLPVGILIMVISNFSLLAVEYIIQLPKTWFSIPLAVVCSVMYWNLFQFGWKIAFGGLEIDDTEKQ